MRERPARDDRGGRRPGSTVNPQDQPPVAQAADDTAPLPPVVA
jgi:hypothetical protein